MGVCSEAWRIWTGSFSLGLSFDRPRTKSSIGVFAGGGVGACLADINLVCLISP